ncbi:MAG: hypothetical protein PHN57_05175 [Candidatus Omnitrophica bacterium]|nr:hypothetical protein [Candidatus Omnitrophota bacterium]
MTAGVPGSGIGGFFYLLSALLMPVQESVSVCMGKSNRASRKMVFRQVLNAMGVLCGVWLTGWFISRAFKAVYSSMHLGDSRMLPVIQSAGLVCGLITLLGVILVIQVFSITARKTRPRSGRA